MSSTSVGAEIAALLVDERALARLIGRLSRGVDRLDRDLIASCYTVDSQDHHGSFRGTGAEFADYMCGGSPISRASTSMIHILGQMLFDVRSDEAFGETAFTFSMALTDEHPDQPFNTARASGNLYQAVGRYVDYFKRVDGQWLLHYRRVVVDWQGVIPGTNGDVPVGGVLSARDRTDPVYDERRQPPTD